MVPKSDKSTNAATPERAPQITPMPFPGESPTVALAMAAGERFGFHEDAKARAKPNRKAPAKKAKTTRKAASRKRARTTTRAR